MFHSTGTLAGLAGAALILANVVSSAPAQSTDRTLSREPSKLVAAGKGDRLPTQGMARPLARVISVELVGVTEASVILRDRDGAILYRSDPVTNTTLVSKDADIPTVTVKEAASNTAQRQPVRRIESKEQPAQPPKRRMPVGCEGVVSVLVDQDSRRVPGLCLAQADLRRYS